VKVLLDENLAHRLRKNLGTHEVFTVRHKGWAGLKNGELLRTAEREGIEVFLTGDPDAHLRTEPYRAHYCNRGFVLC
jgi:predicted nuclease of predicted toxin-antitoxin system